MKKIAITMLALTGMATFATYGQGLVSFSSSASSATFIKTNSVDGGAGTGNIGGAGSYYFALYYSATATTVGGSQTGVSVGNNGLYAFNDPVWKFLEYGTNTASAGKLAGLSNLAVPGVVGAGTAQFVVIGWSGNIGLDAASVKTWLANPSFAGFIGQSSVSGALTLGDGQTVATPNVFGAVAPTVQGFVLGSITPTVPEPATLALAGLGAAAVLIFRRRNSK